MTFVIDFWDKKQESRDEDKEFENQGRQGRRRPVEVWFWYSNDSYEQNYDQHRQTISKISVGEHHLKNNLKNFQIILAINFKKYFQKIISILFCSITEEKWKNSLMIPHLLIKWLIHRLFRRFFGEISFNCKIWLTVRFLMSKIYRLLTDCVPRRLQGCWWLYLGDFI